MFLRFEARQRTVELRLILSPLSFISFIKYESFDLRQVAEENEGERQRINQTEAARASASASAGNLNVSFAFEVVWHIFAYHDILRLLFRSSELEAIANW